jgi:putative ABC transport system permease protein
MRLPISAQARKAIADITRRKGRAILVVLGIMIGVIGITAINVSDSMLGSGFAYSLDRSTSADITYLVSSVDQTLVPAIATVPNVDTVQLNNAYNTRWDISGGSGHVPIQINAYQNFQAIKLGKFELSSGHYPGTGEIVLESSDNTLQKFTLGDYVQIETSHGPVRLHVAGLARTLGLPSAGFAGEAFGIMSVPGLQTISNITAPNVVLVKVHDLNKENQTARAVADLLHAHSITVLRAQISGPNFGQVAANALFTIMRLISIIALLLTGFLIVNTITTLIAEQTKIIGTMKTIGGTRWTIMRGYLTSVVVYAIMGTILGIGLGILAGYELTQFLISVITLDLGPFQIPFSAIIQGAIVGLAVPLLAAIIPLWQGTRITVRQAMASYGVSNGNGKKAHKASRQSAAIVPQTVWLGLRSIFRKPGRVVLTLFTLTLSGAVFMAVQTTNSSIDNTMNVVFGSYIGDIYVGVNPTSYTQLTTALQNVPGIDRIERTASEDVKTDQGSIRISAYAPGTQMYHPQLLAGRWYTSEEPGTIVISDNVAQKMHLHVGDTFTFSSPTNTASWKIIGEVHDLNGSVGELGSVLTTINNLNTFNTLPKDLTTSLVIRAKDHSIKAVDQLANRIDTTLNRAGLSPAIETRQQNIDVNQTQFQIIYILFYAVAVIVALVGILGLFNTLSASVLERRREIGILRSIGASSWRISAVFWIEGLTLALIAWGIGVLLGIPGAYGFVSLLSAILISTDFSFNPLSIATMLGFVLIIATLASFVPTLSASRIRIADTLRYE